MDENKLEELRELVDFLKANGIAEFDMERADLKVRIKFAGAGRQPSAARSCAACARCWLRGGARQSTSASCARLRQSAAAAAAAEPKRSCTR